jgi:hypothetical protein
MTKAKKSKMTEEVHDQIMQDVDEYLDSLDAGTGVPIRAEQLKSLLDEIKICNWRTVTDIANEIREELQK